jgi:pyruvate dehydrogenase E2 component (dihydrolipoamide acetyltransferase)
MEEGSLVEWLKHDGDQVNVGDVICRIEGDKAIDDVEAFDAGVLRIPPSSPAAGQKVPVGTLLAYLVAPGETAPFERGTSIASAGARVAPSAAALASSGNGSATATRPAPPTRASDATPAISPRARRIATELGVDWTALAGSGRTGRIVERDVRAAASQLAAEQEQSAGLRVSPLVRRIAEESGVDLDALTRDHPGQRITREQVEAAARTAVSAAPITAEPTSAAPRPATSAGELAGRRTPFTGVRQLIANRLATSAHTVAPVTLTTEADATDLVRLRNQIKADLAGSDEPLPSYNDLLAKLVAVALGEHLALNASLEGDEIVQHATVNIGIAVDSNRGLLVPVIRDVRAKSVHRIAAESARLVAAARTGQISPDDLRGGTFTITNLGPFDIDAFTPIINLPECAILGVGRIVSRPVVIDEKADQIAVRKMLALSLTFDHRLVDGAPAARFLQRVKHFVEQPTLWLIR